MFDKAMEHPWISLAFVVTFALLNIAASLRLRRDLNKKERAKVDRRKASRTGSGRRWTDHRKSQGENKC